VENDLSIFCRFNKKKWYSQIKILSKGDRVKYLGKIKGIKRLYISLDDCEIDF